MGEYLPLFIDFSGKKVVIFGGGAVGERKARYFAGAEVTVVSREFTQCLEEMGRDGVVRLDCRSVGSDDVASLIEGAFLVVAATGDKALNDEITRIAVERGILANNATGDSPAIVPSLVKKGDIMVAISTGGRSPAIAKYLRKRLELALGDDIGHMLSLQEAARDALKSIEKDQKRREQILWEILEDAEVWEALQESDEKAMETARRHFRPDR
ncbi:precorrin-2 dehydrogenase/sirohydrochlorin ferrochelatase family protein [Methanocella conradii]|uniref:precorrin-2 dehydrogenase/sirohydrochlorin ferrochelatase family protein n=1 Tax=Methanocella conradii TaxID=1175444 RepID=UPI0024B33103|nr:bifunctional precorrin-2 dehydrogenase/sirohydrochlorin ferrochelatase [Methanocella conradii]MDI6896659.1 bifunctional precorrin-2 dehydrogenase/sirohydrochlorin ferrochelatase [Methanocella conradii]